MTQHRRTYSPLTLRALASLGKRIQLARKQRRMSESDLATRIGIARSLQSVVAVWAVANGLARPE